MRARDRLAGYVRIGAARRRRVCGRLDHWVGMLALQPQADGSPHTRCSALVYLTPSGGSSKVLYAYVMEDVLVRTHTTWRIAHRRVTRDDLARARAITGAIGRRRREGRPRGASREWSTSGRSLPDITAGS